MTYINIVEEIDPLAAIMTLVFVVLLMTIDHMPTVDKTKSWIRAKWIHPPITTYFNTDFM
jgi:hypothetical protein